MPVDSKVVIRPRSALGLKYVELDTGRSKKVFADGATMPADAGVGARSSIDEVYNMFDEPTRRASQGNLQGFGDALAGRGADLNQTIQVAPAALRPPRLGHGQPVRPAHRAARASSRSSATPRASSRRSRRPTRTSSRRWPTPSRRSRATRRRSRTRSPRARRRCDAGDRVAARAAPVPRAHRRALARPRRRRRPSCAATLPTVNSALRVGTPVQRRSVAAQRRPAGRARRAARTSSRRRPRIGALRGLTATVGTLQPQLRYLGPYVTVCNSWNIFWTFAAEHLSAPDDTGSLAARAAQHGHAGSRAPTASARRAPTSSPTARARCRAAADAVRAQQRLRRRPSTSKGNADCGAGQTGYIQAYNPLRDKSVKGDPYQGVVDRALPDQRAPRADLRAVRPATARAIGLNPDHVPAGETFTDRPGGHGVDIARPQP